jgi:poly-gamma-glutamate capsule biosynthesis protein CapA/YwtB (metallophosphatase superfamily)
MELLKQIVCAVILGMYWLHACFCLAEVRDDRVASINITGDVLLDRGVKKLIDVAGVSGVMSEVASLFSSADYTLINLECPVTEIVAPGKKTYVFRADPWLLTGLRSAGVTHAGVANNHTLDQGESGFADTVKNLARAGITAVGVINGEANAVRPEVIEKNGVKIAVFAVNMVEIKSSDNVVKQARPCEASSAAMLSAVKSFHGEHPEIHEIVFLHWGEEYSLFPNDDQVYLARRLIDAGADAVVGCHPHVIQGVEVYHGRPIVYSLGNLLFDQSLPETQHRLVVTLFFGKDSLEKAILHPIKQIGCMPHQDAERRLDLKKDKTMLPSEIIYNE